MTDVTEVLRPLLEGAQHVVPSSSAIAWLLESATEQLVQAVAHDQPATAVTAFPVSDSPLSRRALATGSAVAASAEAEGADPVVLPGTRSAFALRLGPAGKPLGLLVVCKAAPRTFAARQRSALQALSVLGSAALAAVQRTAELELAEANRAQFMHITTHELRSPLAVSQTLIRNVVKGYAGPLTEKQHDVFRRISGQLDALESLVNDLLDLAASRSTAAISEPVLLNASVGRAVLLLQPRAEEKAVDLQFLPCREGLVVWATEDGLDRVFVNLVGNAVKYTPSGGRVTVSLTRGVEQARVIVADTGIGIPPEGLTHLYEEFYRAPNARSANIPGTGLGLAIVGELMQRFQGEIRVDSEVGEGTTFTVSLPLYR